MENAENYSLLPDTKTALDEALELANHKDARSEDLVTVKCALALCLEIASLRRAIIDKK